jgi:hypothetical protein
VEIFLEELQEQAQEWIAFLKIIWECWPLFINGMALQGALRRKIDETLVYKPP